MSALRPLNGANTQMTFAWSTRHESPARVRSMRSTRHESPRRERFGSNRGAEFRSRSPSRKRWHPYRRTASLERYSQPHRSPGNLGQGSALFEHTTPSFA